MDIQRTKDAQLTMTCSYKDLHFQQETYAGFISSSTIFFFRNFQIDNYQIKKNSPEACLLLILSQLSPE